MFLIFVFIFYAFADDFVGPDTELTGATFQQKKVHSEFIRYQFALHTGENLWVEIQPKDKAGTGACSNDKYTLSPRWELLGISLSREDQPPFIKELCLRLDKFEHQVVFQPSQSQPQSLTTDLSLEKELIRFQHNQFSWLVYVFLFGSIGWVTRLVVRNRNWLSCILLFSLAHGIRLRFSPVHLFNGDQAGYEKLLLTLHKSHHLYGSGVSLLVNPLYLLAGENPEFLLQLNCLLSSCSVVLLYLIGSQLWPQDKRNAVLGALLLAFFPVAVKLSATEVYTIPSLFFALYAILCSLVYVKRKDLYTFVVLVGMLFLATQTRPEAIFVCLLPIWVSLTHQCSGLVTILMGCTFLVWHRLSAIDLAAAQQIMKWDFIFSMEYWRGWLPHNKEGLIVWGHFGVTPILYWLMAWIGLAYSKPRFRLFIGGWVLLAWFPVAPKTIPMADGLRLFLLMQMPLLLFASQGLAVMRRFVDQKILICIIGCSFVFHIDWIQRLWVNQQEWSIAKQAIPQIPPNTKLQMDSSIAKWGKKAAVFEWLSDYRIEVIEPKHSPGWFWRGPLCDITQTCTAFIDSCDLQEISVKKVPNYTDVDVQLPEKNVTIGLYKVISCRKQ